MYVHLTISTAMFVTQAVVTLLAFGVLGGSTSEVALVAVISILPVVGIGFALFVERFTSFAAAGVLAVASSTFAFELSGGTTTYYSSVGAVVASVFFAGIGITLATFAAREARQRGATEPTWAIVLALMPVGIGMVAGGILYSFFRNRKSSKNIAVR